QAEKDLFILLSTIVGELLYSEMENRRNAEFSTNSILKRDTSLEQACDDNVQVLLSQELERLSKAARSDIRDRNMAAIVAKIQNSDQIAKIYGEKQLRWL